MVVCEVGSEEDERMGDIVDKVEGESECKSRLSIDKDWKGRGADGSKLIREFIALEPRFNRQVLS